MSKERVFTTHEIRKQVDLDGMWDFQTIGEQQLPHSYSYSLSVSPPAGKWYCLIAGTEDERLTARRFTCPKQGIFVWFSRGSAIRA